MEEDIKKVFSLVFGKDFSESENPIYGKASYWDSLKHIELILSLEEYFEISFSKSEMEKITSIKNIKSLLENKIEK